MRSNHSGVGLKLARGLALGLALIYFAVSPASLLAQNTYPWPASGNVGIGTVSPDAPLSVSGSLHVIGGTSTGINIDNGVALNAKDVGGTARSIFAGWTNNNAYIGPQTGFADTYFRAATGNMRFTFAGAEKLTILNTGYVGIGTTNPVHLLHVAGTIGAQEVIVSSNGADYVFQPGYRLKPLPELAAYIAANRHLPDIPSEGEVKNNGLGVGEMQTKLLAKIEELTLHLIREHERNEELQKRLERLEAQSSAH